MGGAIFGGLEQTAQHAVLGKRLQVREAIVPGNTG